MPCSLFISDLHLDPQRPDTTRLLLEFLATRARTAAEVYILGDLFEAWVGDDDDSPLGLQVIAALRACVDAGTPIRVMHGNRDFLLGETFARQSGCGLLTDPAVLDLYGVPTLLMHGDLLCTDDSDYAAFRRQVRSRDWQQAFLARPAAERRRLAMQMRDASRSEMQRKPDSFMDVNSGVVIRLMTAHRVLRLIHGHTHRPAVHDITIRGQPAQRWVLGDWYARGSYLECDPEGCRLQTLS